MTGRLLVRYLLNQIIEEREENRTACYLLDNLFEGCSSIG
jgi:hypothetical protein